MYLFMYVLSTTSSNWLRLTPRKSKLRKKRWSTRSWYNGHDFYICLRVNIADQFGSAPWPFRYILCFQRPNLLSLWPLHCSLYHVFSFYTPIFESLPFANSPYKSDYEYAPPPHTEGGVNNPFFLYNASLTMVTEFLIPTSHVQFPVSTLLKNLNSSTYCIFRSLATTDIRFFHRYEYYTNFCFPHNYLHPILFF